MPTYPIPYFLTSNTSDSNPPSSPSLFSIQPPVISFPLSLLSFVCFVLCETESIRQSNREKQPWNKQINMPSMGWKQRHYSPPCRRIMPIYGLFFLLTPILHILSIHWSSGKPKTQRETEWEKESRKKDSLLLISPLSLTFLLDSPTALLCAQRSKETGKNGKRPIATREKNNNKRLKR